MNQTADYHIHILHHNGPDGVAAAAVLRTWLVAGEVKAGGILLPAHCKVAGYTCYRAADYKDHPALAAEYRQVYNASIFILDFSVPDDLITALLKQGNEVTWIDHHKTGEHSAHNGLPGIRYFGPAKEGPSGAKLTWQWCFPDRPVPEIIERVSDYDTWAFKLAGTETFFEGLKAQPWYMDPTSFAWDGAFQVATEGEKQVLERIFTAGAVAQTYRDTYCTALRGAFGYQTEIFGQPAYALNCYRLGSLAFGSLKDQYPILIAYIHDGRKFTVSLYGSRPDTPHLGELCKQHFSGGGLAGAAGFVCDTLPFQRTDTPRE